MNWCLPGETWSTKYLPLRSLPSSVCPSRTMKPMAAPKNLLGLKKMTVAVSLAAAGATAGTAAGGGASAAAGGTGVAAGSAEGAGLGAAAGTAAGVSVAVGADAAGAGASSALGAPVAAKAAADTNTTIICLIFIRRFSWIYCGSTAV